MKRLDQIRERLEAATPGPWKTAQYDLTLYVEDETGVLDPINFGYVGNRPERNAEFVAAAPTDITALLGAVEATLKLADQWQAVFPYKASQVRAAITTALEGNQP